MICVTLICDDGYVMPTVVAMVSIINTKSIDTIIDFYILADSLKTENKVILKSLENDSCKVKIVDVDSSGYKGLEKKHSSVSRASLLKFSIPEIIKDVDKVLYIDGDVIVKKDLSELYNITLGEKYAAVVADGPKKAIAGNKKHSYYGDPSYFNSGMMLLNIKKMRKDGLTKKLVDFRLNEYNYFMDQDAFNKVLGGNVVYLSLKYDMMFHLISFMNEDCSIEQLKDFYHLDCYDTIDEMLEDAVILHYTLAKPWKYYDIPGANDWIFFYKKSPFASNLLKRTSFMTYVLNAKRYRFARKVNSFLSIFRDLIK